MPADAQAVRIPIATTFSEAGASAMIVTFYVDDVRVARALLTNEEWQDITVTLPPRGWRRVRRSDVRTSVTREDNHGVKIGEAQGIRAAVSASASAELRGQAGT